MRKRTGYTLLVVFLILCALAAAIVLRQKAPPEVARLLPESDAIVYFNLAPLRAATHFDRNPPAPAPSYQQFIDATGIVAERDLNQAAFALHRMPDPSGPNGPVAFSEVFSGHFDSARLTKYLATQSTSQEIYAGHTIYSIPSERRTLRVTLLDYETIAASNAPTTEQLHSIVDRARAAASPFAGSSLLSARYADIPPFSSAWAIGHIGLPFGQNGKIALAGLELPIPADTTFVASLRYGGSLHLRIDQLTPSESAAIQSAQSLTNLLTLFRNLQHNQQPTDPALTQFLDSIKIEPHKDRATLTATLPPEALKHIAQVTGAP
jgi:hypothetical protein